MGVGALMEWVAAFLLGAVVVAVVGGLAYLAIENPEGFSVVAAFIVLSFLVGWGLARWTGWWGAWVRG